MRRKKKGFDFQGIMAKIARGFVLTFLLLTGFFFYNRNMLKGEMFLSEILPYYKPEEDMAMLFKLNVEEGYAEPEFEVEDGRGEVSPVYEDIMAVAAAEETLDLSGLVPDKPAIRPERMEVAVNMREGLDIVGINDITYQPETDGSRTGSHTHGEMLTLEDTDKLKNLEYLKNSFYILDARTNITEDLFNAEEFLGADLSVNLDGRPKVLIFHTHSMETYVDSNDISEGVLAVGEKLARELAQVYGIQAIHHTGSYDMVNGINQVQGAYERMEPEIIKILNENPSIEVVIDVHRDGLRDESIKLISNIDGRDAAQIMFVNGLSRIYENGVLKDINILPNPNLKTNLAFSFMAQLTANTLYPGFARKSYINAYRYSLHMLPKSLLVEVGAQTNTKEEALNAVAPLAEIIYQVITQ